METKHTQGPWVVHHDGHYPRIRKHFHETHHMDVCGPVHGYMYSQDEKCEQAANARLIAAAPELLETLSRACTIIKDMIDKCDYVGCGTIEAGDLEEAEDRKRLAEVQAAIAKATGEA